MQVNLPHHPDAFVLLEEGFDPLADARHAARFLLALRERAERLRLIVERARDYAIFATDSEARIET